MPVETTMALSEFRCSEVGKLRICRKGGRGEGLQIALERRKAKNGKMGFPPTFVSVSVISPLSLCLFGGLKLNCSRTHQLKGQQGLVPVGQVLVERHHDAVGCKRDVGIGNRCQKEWVIGIGGGRERERIIEKLLSLSPPLFRLVSHDIIHPKNPAA